MAPRQRPGFEFRIDIFLLECLKVIHTLYVFLFNIILQSTIEVLAQNALAQRGDVPQRDGGDPRRDRAGGVSEDHGSTVQTISQMCI